jgi:hypothetical protein
MLTSILGSILVILLPNISELNLQPAALTACNEAGTNIYEGALVLQIAVNRSKKNQTTLNHELTLPNQFNPYKECSTLSIDHFRIAIAAHSDALEVPSVIKNTKITYYDSRASQSTYTNKCPGYTVGDKWEYNGLIPVFRSDVDHIFFIQTKNQPGCPPKDYTPPRKYLAIKQSKELRRNITTTNAKHTKHKRVSSTTSPASIN